MRRIMLSVALLVSILSAKEPLTVVTESLPPYQIRGEDSITGISTEIVTFLLQEANEKYTLNCYPWARAYEMAQRDTNTLIYSIVPLEERQKKFQWIGQLTSFEPSFFKRREDTTISVTSLEDAKKYRVGVVRGDGADIFITSQNIPNISRVGSSKQLIYMLLSNRVDLIFSNKLTLQQKIEYAEKTKGPVKVDPEKISHLYSVKEISSELWIAASLRTDPAIVKRLSETLKTMKKRGTCDSIINSWHQKE